MYIHYGDNKFDINKFKEIRNHEFLNKPHGGLWASDINSEFGWKDWCIKEDYRTDELNKSFKFILNENSKVLTINDVNDLRDLPMIKFESFIGIPKVYLDFEKLKEKYDAIEVIINEQLYYTLYGWDCDSILIMNPEIVKEVKDNEQNIKKN